MAFSKNYRHSIMVKDHVKARHILVGDFTYYSGYYHGRPFEDCVMYLDARDNHRSPQTLDRLIIGKFCAIATGAQFMMGGTQGHNYDWIACYPMDFLDEDFDGYDKVPPKGQRNKGDTVIGNDVWIGAQAMIMPGVRIGDGAIVGARSLITKPIGPYEIWGGNPARLIKTRFSDEQIQKLLQIRWWNWDLRRIRSCLGWIRSANVDGLWQHCQEEKWL
jgi:chloramphenicol O-acetyltransferase type B